MRLEMGTLLQERFRLLRLLGEGGMGEVYLGEDERGGAGDGRPVAIKVLRTELNEKHELFSRRFREEIEILRRLDQLGVPAFVDAFEEGSRSFLIMEYVEGNSLESLLDLSPTGLPPVMVAEVGVQVCKILEHLHGQTPPLIHRDIKPANLIIRRQDELVFLVDFGLAREFDSEIAARTLVGTVGYCPLEQLQGHPEPRSDLYALGATLFELLTGKIPKPLNIPPVRSVVPDVPENFANLVDQCVRSGMDDRPADAATMRRALEVIRQQLNPGPVSLRKPRPSNERAAKLLQSWGRTQATSAESGGQPQPTSWKERWRPLALMVLLLSLVFCGVNYSDNYRERQHYLTEQRDLVLDALPDGVPGPAWRLDEVLGIFPAYGLGLGGPDLDWDSDSSVRSGVIYSSEPRTVRFMSFRLRRLKGAPRLLVFCQPWAILVDPRAKGYELRLLRVSEGISLEATPWKEFQPVTPLKLGGIRQLEVELLINGRTGQILVDKRVKRKFVAPDAWKSKSSGVILLNAVKKTRCVVESWQLS